MEQPSGNAHPSRPWWRNRKRLFWLGVLAVLVLCIETIPRFPFGPFTLYPPVTAEQQAARIPYDHLSTEETDPFNNEFPHIGKSAETLRQMRRFPGVRDCLIASERDEPDPDLRLLNWAKIRNTEAANVCTFRVFASLGSPGRATEWAEFQGFRAKGSGQINRFFRNPIRFRPSGFLDGSSPKWPVYGFNNLWRWLFYLDEDINAEWAPSGDLVRVGWSHNFFIRE